MSSHGTIQDMINRMKQNEAHRKALQAHRRHLRSTFADKSKPKITKVKDFDISPADLETLKIKIRADIHQARRATRKRFALIGFPIIITSLYLIYEFVLKPVLQIASEGLDKF